MYDRMYRTEKGINNWRIQLINFLRTQNKMATMKTQKKN